MLDLLLTDALILTGEDYVPLRGCLGIRGETIAWIGESLPEEKAVSVKSLHGSLLLPGLVNAHGHAAMVLLRGAGRTVIYNPAPAVPADRDLLDAVSYLTPNEHEARIVLGDGETPIETLIERFGGKLIVTLGAQGLAGWDGGLLRVPAIPAKVADTTGAGDTMNGAFAAALAEGMTCADALRFANAAAGIATESPGAQAGMPTRAEVEKRL